MRTYLFILFACACSLVAHAQAQTRSITQEDVPLAVKNEFSKSHPSAFDITWKKFNADYVVEYTRTTTTSYATYSSEGKLIESRDKITTFALPAPAYDYIKLNYADVPLKEYFKITDAAGLVTFSAKIKNQEVIFDKKGTYIKTIDFSL